MDALTIADLDRDTDLDGCVAAYRAAFAAAPWHEAWAPRTVRGRLEEILDTPRSLVLVARLDTEVVGLLAGYTESFHPHDRFQLAELAVAPQHQARGIGTALVRRLVDRLAEADVAEVFLITAPAAEAFWRAQSFQVSTGRVVMARRSPAGAAAPPRGRPMLLPYQPDWVERGARLVARLEGVASPRGWRVEHIGSTAIPGMAAKDVLDLQVSVTDLDEAAGLLDTELAGLGFVRQPYEHDHVPAGRDDDPRRWTKRVWSRRGHPDGDANLHARLIGSPGERVALLFRDWFRSHPEAVPAYAAFKRALAGEVGDVAAYSDVKDPVVDLVTVVAEQWAERTGWAP